MARLSFALPILDRCERPRTASVRICRLQPGRLAHGPDEKCGIAGRTPGLVAVMLSILPDRRPSLGRGVPLAEIGDLPIEVNSRSPGTKPGGWRMLSLELKELQEPRPEAEESRLIKARKLAAGKKRGAAISGRDLAQRFDDIIHDRLDKPSVVTFPHYPDHRLGAGRTDNQTAATPEFTLGTRDDGTHLRVV